MNVPLKKRTVAQRKKDLLRAMEATLGIVTPACKKAEVSKSTFWNYYNKDENFKKAADEIMESALDFAESQLFKQIRENNHVSTIFYLKCKGKKRGYIEKQEIEHSGDFKMSFDNQDDGV